jgi:hypothetical protein
MVYKVPLDFNVNSIGLDPSEEFIRDQLKLNVVNWAKFRHTIGVGNQASNLKPVSGTIHPGVEEAYRELAKSHYEVITSLGSAKVSFDLATQTSHVNELIFKKAYKDFYFHIGCLLDNLARIVYIINDPKSASATYLRGPLKGKIIRHWIDWGRLRAYPGYARLKRSKKLMAIINIRNVFTHGWSCPIFVERNSGTLYWPVAIRTKRDFYWPYDERSLMQRHYRKKQPILQMIEQDFGFIESFQNKVFGKLAKDVRKFEKSNDVEIR